MKLELVYLLLNRKRLEDLMVYYLLLLLLLLLLVCKWIDLLIKQLLMSLRSGHLLVITHHVLIVVLDVSIVDVHFILVSKHDLIGVNLMRHTFTSWSNPFRQVLITIVISILNQLVISINAPWLAPLPETQAASLWNWLVLINLIWKLNRSPHVASLAACLTISPAPDAL